jgi:outer membrane protein OmpA-like peptidoglycan-associated protein
MTQEAGRIRVALEAAILFDFDRYNLRPEGDSALAKIKGAVIDVHPSAHLIVEGHTDDRGREPIT